MTWTRVFESECSRHPHLNPIFQSFSSICAQHSVMQHILHIPRTLNTAADSSPLAPLFSTQPSLTSDPNLLLSIHQFYTAGHALSTHSSYSSHLNAFTQFCTSHSIYVNPLTFSNLPPTKLTLLAFASWLSSSRGIAAISVPTYLFGLQSACRLSQVLVGLPSPLSPPPWHQKLFPLGQIH
mmetsp:Transcript_12818/g.21595  ORF Transcript_12818/g.21595 Transcript_12818/m.21595 type:complete len:181 (+) Transcript_12818:1265-1807(+)